MDGAPPQTATFLAGRNEDGLRLDAYLSRALDVPRSKAKKLIQRGGCRVNGRVETEADFRVRSGHAVYAEYLPESGGLVPEKGDLVIVYRDEYLAVLDKPPYLTVHPCPSCPQGTLAHRLPAYFPELDGQGGLRPGIVHRLDKDTTGLMIVALSEAVRLSLSAMFAGRTIAKTYLALVRGVPPLTGSSRLPLGRHPTIKTRMAVVPESKGGRNAFSEWRVLYADPAQKFALLAVDIHTGRTHQIRVHLAEAGYPLWGDRTYGPADDNDPAPRQMLHAWKLAFPHPVTNDPMAFTCPPPPDFAATVTALARTTTRLILTGNPGCGKSTALKLLEEKNIPVWSADASVAALYRPGNDAWLMLRGRYGDRFISGPEEPPDRNALTQAMSEDPGLRREIEDMVHPMVFNDMMFFFHTAEEAAEPLAVAEVPLWFESRKEMPLRVELVATVTCPQSLRHERLRLTRGWPTEKSAAVEAWQWPEEAKAKAADLLVDNSGNPDRLVAAVTDLLREVERRQRHKERSLLEQLGALWGEDKRHPTR